MLIKEIIIRKPGIELLTIINENFMVCLNELREYVIKDIKENKSPIIRLIQIEEYLKKTFKCLIKFTR